MSKGEIIVDGFAYKLDSFPHPGGSVIKFYDGQDASDCFHALHDRSDKARRTLKNLKGRPVTKEDPVDDSPLIKDFRELRRQLHEEGRFNPLWSVQIARFAECVFLQWFSMWVLVHYSAVLGGVLYGLTVGRVGLLMHDQGHRAFFGDQRKDTLIHKLFFGFAITGSGSYWNNQHNKHHAATQELTHDVDLKTLPFVAFHPAIAETASPAVRAWLRFQAIFFVPVQLLLFYSWKFLHLRHAWRTREWVEVGAILSHHLLYLYCYPAGLGAYAVYELIGYAIGGCYLATVFSINHTHHDVSQPGERRDWVTRNSDYTTNSYHNFWVRWLTGYLCFQTEHHLFPSMPHPQLMYAAPRVEALLKKHGKDYNITTMSDGFKKVFSNLHEVGNPSPSKQD